jgi:hypothetical protein
MNTDLHNALEHLDIAIDRLDEAADAFSKTKSKGAPKNRAEIINKLDAVIGRVEAFLAE